MTLGWRVATIGVLLAGGQVVVRLTDHFALSKYLVAASSGIGRFIAFMGHSHPPRHAALPVQSVLPLVLLIHCLVVSVSHCLRHGVSVHHIGSRAAGGVPSVVFSTSTPERLSH
jgi:hypothetical protein